jgi:hypothetical protein
MSGRKRAGKEFPSSIARLKNEDLEQQQLDNPLTK